MRLTVSRLGVDGQHGSGAVVEEIMDRLRHRPIDSRHPLQVQHAGLGHAAGRAEMVEQRALALGADPRDLVQHRSPDVARPLARDGSGSRTGAPRRAAAGQSRGPDRAGPAPGARGPAGRTAPARRCARAPWPPRAAAGRPGRARPATAWAAASCPAPPSMTTSPGQPSPGPLRVLLDQPREPALQHLAHHGVVVAGGELAALDVEGPVAALVEALRPGDDEGADRVAALDVAVVVDLDPGRRLRQVEPVGQLLEQRLLARRVREPPRQRLAGVGRARSRPAAAGRRAAAPAARPCARPAPPAPRPAAPAPAPARPAAPAAPAPARRRTAPGTPPGSRRASRPWCAPGSRRGCRSCGRPGRRTPGRRPARPPGARPRRRHPRPPRC